MKPQALRAAWQQRSVRERRLLLLAAWLLGLAVAWQWAISPALATWRSAAQQQLELDRQTRQMQQWQTEARQLSTPARMTRAQAVQWLETSATEMLGKNVRVVLQGEQLQVTLTAATPTGLARWLSQAREKAQALVQTAELQQISQAKTSTGSDSDVLWSGQLTLRLP